MRSACDLRFRARDKWEGGKIDVMWSHSMTGMLGLNQQSWVRLSTHEAANTEAFSLLVTETGGKGGKGKGRKVEGYVFPSCSAREANGLVNKLKEGGLPQLEIQAQKRQERVKKSKMPEKPDGLPEDEDGVPGPNINQPRSGYFGKEGRPTHYIGPREEFIPAWRYPLRAQISAMTDEIRSIEDDIEDWKVKASAEDRKSVV